MNLEENLELEKEKNFSSFQNNKRVISFGKIIAYQNNNLSNFENENDLSNFVNENEISKIERKNLSNFRYTDLQKLKNQNLSFENENLNNSTYITKNKKNKSVILTKNENSELKKSQNLKKLSNFDRRTTLDQNSIFESQNFQKKKFFNFSILLKKIIKYSRKINKLKKTLFEENQNFNLLGIFELYDIDLDGNLTLLEFTDLIKDLNLKMSDLQKKRLFFYINFFCEKNKKDYLEDISFENFINFFLPFQKNFMFLKKFFFDKMKKKMNEENAEKEKFSIKKKEILIMQKIFINILKKIKSFNNIMKSFDKNFVKEIFFFISENKNFISYENLRNFMKKNYINIPSEYYVYIYQNFQVDFLKEISFSEFNKFMNNALWQIH